MNSDWSFRPLGELCHFFSGGTPKKGVPEYWDGDIPWISAATLKDTQVSSSETTISEAGLAQGSRIAKTNDILLLVRGSGLFKGIPIARVASEVAFNQDIKAIRAGDDVSPQFLFASLFGLRSKLEEMLEFTGIGAGKLDTNKLKALPISVPSKEVQEQVSGIFEGLDDKIANNRALAADLESMARAIFKSWFVDFDPVKAKMEGRAPAGMDADTAALFPDELVESELGLIPKGWEVGTLESQADLNPESWSARNHPDAVQYADLSGTDRGQILETKEFAWTDAPSRARRALRPGDTIVGTVRPGNRAYSYVGIDGLTGSTGFAVLRPHGTSQRSFVYLAATSDDAIERLTNLADGAAYPAVRPDVVLATPIVAPPDTVLREFAKLTAPLLDWMVAGHAENTELAKLRDALLPRLISGKLRLPCIPTEAGSTPSEEHADV